MHIPVRRLSYEFFISQTYKKDNADCLGCRSCHCHNRHGGILCTGNLGLLAANYFQKNIVRDVNLASGEHPLLALLLLL